MLRLGFLNHITRAFPGPGNYHHAKFWTQFFKIFYCVSRHWISLHPVEWPDCRLDMLKWLVKNPFKSLAIFAIGSSVLNWYLKRKVREELQVSVYQKLVSGSRPLLLTSHSGTVIRRPQVEEDIRISLWNQEITKLVLES